MHLIFVEIHDAEIAPAVLTFVLITVVQNKLTCPVGFFANGTALGVNHPNLRFVVGLLLRQEDLLK